MKLHNNKLSALLSSLFLTATFLLSGCKSQKTEIVNASTPGPELLIVHTNDTHSQIDPATTTTGIEGGVVERASLLELMRKSDPELLYLDAGDMVQGSPYFNIWNGKVEVEAMNLQGLIATTFGNHEFDNGLAYLDTMLTQADFPILSCNYDCTGTVLEPHIKKHLIVECKGVKIGITGVTANPDKLVFDKNWKGITYLDPSEAANKEAAILRQEGCDIVILLSHVGYSKSDTIGDRYIASHSHDIDLIIGGHTHTNLENGVKVLNADGKPVILTQTGGKANPIGEIKIYTSTTNKRKNGRWAYSIDSVECTKLHPADYDLTGLGQEATKLITPYRDNLQEKMNIIVGHTETDLFRFRPQSPLGNFISDAMREIASEIYGHKIDVAVMNIGGIRNDIEKGDITLGDLFRILPFENTVSIIELKGRDLEAIVHAVEFKKLEAFSGLQITLEQQEGKYKATRILVGGEPIDPEKIYYVTTINYLAEGNDSMDAMKNAIKNTDTGILIRDAIHDYIKSLTTKGETINVSIDDRVIEIGE